MKDDVDDVTFVNLTPHDVVVYNDSKLFTIKNQGDVARIDVNLEETDEYFEVEHSDKDVNVLLKSELDENKTKIPLYRERINGVIGLPEPKKGVLYIVSRIVANFIGDTRDDILVPIAILKDENGNMSACRGLAFSYSLTNL